MATLLYKHCLLPYVWKGELLKLLFQLCSRKDKETYHQGGCLLWQGKKGQKSQLFFSKQHDVAGLSLCCILPFV